MLNLKNMREKAAIFDLCRFWKFLVQQNNRKPKTSKYQKHVDAKFSKPFKIHFGKMLLVILLKIW